MTKVSRRAGERGAEMVECSLVLVPMLALVLLAADVAWAVFAKATLQEAVREGVRYGVTGGTGTGLDASIRQTVTTYSFGFITAANQSDILIAYYAPGDTTTNLAGTSGATAGGNILQVSINGLTLKALGAVGWSATPLNLSASAADVMESLPPGAARSE